MGRGKGSGRKTCPQRVKEDMRVRGLTEERLGIGGCGGRVRGDRLTLLKGHTRGVARVAKCEFNTSS